MHKAFGISAFVLLAMAGIAAAPAKQSAKVNIPFEVSWAGKAVPQGEYTFQWQGDTDNVAVVILSGRKVIAEGRGRLAQEQTKSPHNGVTTRRQGSGAPLLSRILFRGKTTVLVLAEP